MRIHLTLLFFVLISLKGFGQTKDSINENYIHQYQENADFSYTSPYSEIGAPSKYIISGRVTTQYMLLATNKLPISVAIIPDFTVRVRNEQSAGVRTPSFKLGGSVFFHLNKEINHYKYAELGFTHHSNGQDGDALNPDGSINTYSGNFSTNYLTLSYRFGNNLKSSPDNYSLNHRIGLEWHKWFSYETALEGDYGFTRLLYNFSYRKYQSKNEKEFLRLNADVSYAVNPIQNTPFLNLKKRLNMELTSNYSLSFMRNTFLMATVGYYGEDPYNIYFKDQYSFIRFGISTGFSRFKSNR